jgi:uncharacterized peroxidase-related enzyme
MAEYSTELRVWSPYLEPLDPTNLSEGQRSALEATGKLAHHSPYYRFLALDPPSLVARTTLYDLIMDGEGVPGADRELAALWVSMTNGCKYCASVHARRLMTLRDKEFAERACGHDLAELDERAAAVARLGEGLTRREPDLTSAAIKELRALGLDDVSVADVIQVVSVFAWANRLMLGLGSSAPRERRAR